MSKFFEFSQNNSGGSFIVNREVCHRVVIEADNAREANAKASDLGIYFAGVERGLDCDCCGDRWDQTWDGHENTYPNEWSDGIIFHTPEEQYQYIANKYGWLDGDDPSARIFYKDGRVVEIFRVKSEAA